MADYDYDYDYDDDKLQLELDSDRGPLATTMVVGAASAIIRPRPRRGVDGIDDVSTFFKEATRSASASASKSTSKSTSELGLDPFGAKYRRNKVVETIHPLFIGTVTVVDDNPDVLLRVVYDSQKYTVPTQHVGLAIVRQRCAELERTNQCVVEEYGSTIKNYRVVTVELGPTSFIELTHKTLCDALSPMSTDVDAKISADERAEDQDRFALEHGLSNLDL